VHGRLRQPPAAVELSGVRHIVLVDARNVLRSEWPNIPEDELVELCCRWAKENGVDALVVFDGRAPGGLIGERRLDERCTLVGTGPGEIADEWLIRKAGELAAAGRPYRLVTSDRALRGAAGADAEQTIGGGTFARRLRRP
jgi:predicted RNA-binding protein with PIN domain